MAVIRTLFMQFFICKGTILFRTYKTSCLRILWPSAIESSEYSSPLSLSRQFLASVHKGLYRRRTCVVQRSIGNTFYKFRFPPLRSFAAAAAKSLQSCQTVRPHRWQPTRLLCPWDSLGKNTGVDCHFLLQCVKVKSLSRV